MSKKAQKFCLKIGIFLDCT